MAKIVLKRKKSDKDTYLVRNVKSAYGELKYDDTLLEEDQIVEPVGKIHEEALKQELILNEAHKQKIEEEKRLVEEKAKKEEEEKRLAEEKAKKEEEEKRLVEEKAKKEEEEKRLAEEKAKKEEEKRLAEEKAKKEEEKRLVEEKAKKEEEEKRLAEEKAHMEELRRQQVSAAEVKEIISDETASILIEKEFDEEKIFGNKKGIINIDIISRNFKAGDIVTVNTLKDKKLIDKNICFVKVLARGVIDKPLVVKAQDFSLDAVKMIQLTGGKVVLLDKKKY
ncbi:MAG: uL15 family ribosomal protein [Staphylococcus sp.]|nr:uL15 family ribosomal protein [Staphylococcus sp.]